MRKLMLLSTLLLLSACTYAVTNVHTQGEASDVVDETASNTPSTSLTVPLKA